MRRGRSFLLLAVLALAATSCNLPNLTPPGTAPIRYRDPVFSTVATTADVTYGTATDLSNQTVTLKLDVYQPPASDTVRSRPAIVWVHGGSFCCGTKTSPEIVDEASTFAKAGYVNVSIDYRLEPGGCSASAPTSTCLAAMNEAKLDAETAVTWLRSHAGTYGVDPDRIAIGGSSAGAITALHVGYATSETPAAGVRAALSLSGANLLSTITPGDAPALLFHGTADPLVPYQWALNTVNAARDANDVAFLETWDGAGHVPYAEFRSQVLTQETNFLWWEMDLGHAAH